MKEKTAAIIVAGGQGLRFGGRIRKQYVRLGGRPVVWWSLQAFQRCPAIDGIVLVVPADDLASMQAQVARWRISKLWNVVVGGFTRAQSVQKGLAALPSRVRWVAVHDAVRPLVDSLTITRTLTAGRRHGAAVAALPSRDTVKLAKRGEFIHRTPPRATVWCAQTPQVARRDLFEKGFARWRRHDPPTDDVQLIERLGVPVKLVKASRQNIKITLPVDLKIAQLLLKG